MAIEKRCPKHLKKERVAKSAERPGKVRSDEEE
jgi:hypothetical protein